MRTHLHPGLRGTRNLLGSLVVGVVLLLASQVYAYHPPLTEVTAWVEGSFVHYRVYDPQLGSWRESYSSGSGTYLTVNDGVVAWTDGSFVDYATYDPALQVWKHSYGGGEGTYLTVNGGVVAWTDGSFVDYAVYDPEIQTWKRSYSYEPGATPSILCATVYFGEEARGYKHSTGSWSSTSPTEPFAYYHAAPDSGPTGLWVWFTDMSIGGVSWSFYFDDGQSSSTRSPYHVFNGDAYYDVVLTTTGCTTYDTYGTTVTVGTPPALVLAPDSLAFTYLIGQALPPDQPFDIQNAGTIPFNFNVSEALSWLYVLPGGGGGPVPPTSTQTVSINPAGLSPGTYEGYIVVTAPGAAGSPDSVRVRLLVDEVGLCLSDTELVFYGAPGGVDPENQFFDVINCGAESFDFTISEGLSWLSADPTAGGPVPPSATVTVSVDISGLPAGAYEGNITVTAPGAPDSPQDVHVTLNILSSYWTDVTNGLPLGDEGYTMGAAWGDYDNDGDEDLYLANSGSTSKLLRNDGPGGFVDVTSGPLAGAGSSEAAAWGDYDNDGLLDLFVSNYVGFPNQLLHNEGGGTFTDVTSGPLADTSSPNTCVSWVDYDGDGYVDLSVGSYNTANKLFHNEGDGTFSDASAPPISNAGSAQSMAWADYDNDGDQDLYVGIVLGTSKMIRNDGNGTFTDATTGPLAVSGDTYSGTWGDYDNDGDLDLYVCVGAAPNRLLRNDGAGSFTDVAGVSGDIALPNAGKAAWADCDNDGDLDLFVTQSNSENKLFVNDGSGVFYDICDTLIAGMYASSDVCWADFDSNGYPDLYVPVVGGQNRLFRNDNLSGNHWLQVRLAGTVSNRAGIGARVVLTTASGTQTREVAGGGAGRRCQNSLPIEFGLGTNTAVISLAVRWPSGIIQYVQNAGAYIDGPTLEVIEENITELILFCPNGGEVLAGGDLCEIAWSPLGSVDSIVVAFSDDAGEGWDPVATVPNTGSYFWEVPEANSAECLIRVADASDTLVADTSDSVFAIVSVGDVSIDVDPDGLNAAWLLWGPDGSWEGQGDTLLAGETAGEYVLAWQEVAGWLAQSAAETLYLHADSSITFHNTYAMQPAQVDSFADVPRDQGGWLYLYFERCGLDTNVNGWPDTTVVGYNIYRRVEDPQLLSAIISSANQAPAGGASGSLSAWPLLASAEFGEDLRLVEYEESYYLIAGPDGSAAAPPGVWAVVQYAFAQQQDQYLVLVPTLADSIAGHPPQYSHYYITTHTTVPALVYESSPDSAYSTDNLAPSPPAGLVLASPALLEWNPVPDADFNYFSLYASGAAALDSTATLLGYTVDTQMGVTGEDRYYHVTATDFAGNEGEAASLENASSAAPEPKDIPAAYALLGGRPNPFRGQTAIRFDLPRSGRLSLRVIDVKGQLVRSLADVSYPAGRHSAIWDGRDQRGLVVSPGIYVIRMEAGDFTGARKVILAR